MPVRSRSQARLMGAVASGSLKKKGLSKATAQEFLDATPKGKLPEKVKKPKSRR